MRLAQALYAFGACLLFRFVSSQQLPSEDPFYQPDSVPGFKPGQVIRSRQVSIAQNEDLPLRLKSAHQYLFRTTDSLNQPVAAVTTLLVPSNATDSSRLLSYQIAYDSANNDCSPSYTLRASNQSSTDIAFLSASLAQGWYVAVPDYEGLEAEYAAGISSGRATLDSIRAVLSDNSCNGLRPSPKTILWGYSGGALASEWATELQPFYAPELEPQIVGAALGGLVPNVANLVRMINGGPNVGIAFLGFRGLSKAYPALRDYIRQHLFPAKKAEFDDICSKCTIPAIVEAANMSVFDYFDTGAGILTDPVPASILQSAGVMGKHGVPRMPVFAYKSEGDQYSAIADTDNLVQEFCCEGATIEYHRDSVGNHNTQAITGGATAFAWIEGQFSGHGLAADQGCQVQNVTLHGRSIAEVGGLGQNVINFLQHELNSEGVS